MRIEGSVALVTGANRGIGKAFATALLDQGAATVYAGVRDPASLSDHRLVPLRLDITDPEQVAAAAQVAGDVTILVNNAAVGAGSTLVEGDLKGDLEGARLMMDTNFFGTWMVSRAFAPVLARNGGGAMVNILSVASWEGNPAIPGYAASKTAAWSLSNSMRLGLRAQGTLVIGVYAGFVDTEMSAWTDAPKVSAGIVAEQTMRALLCDAEEVLADDVAHTARARVFGDAT